MFAKQHLKFNYVKYISSLNIGNFDVKAPTLPKD